MQSVDFKENVITSASAPRLPRFTPVNIETSLFYLSYALEAGVPLADALEDLSEIDVQRDIQRVWCDVRRRVTQGEQLTDAMQAWPMLFNSTLCALLRAGEASGRLAPAIHEGRKLLRWHAQLRTRLFNAVLYPMLALALMLMVFVFLMIWIVPSLSEYLTSADIELSWHTRILLGVSDVFAILVSAWLASIVLLCLVLQTLRLRHARARLYLDGLIIKLPGLGSLQVDLMTARYAKVTGQLYEAGLSLVAAFEHAERVVANHALRNELIRSRQKLQAGSTLADAFQLSKNSSTRSLTSLPQTFRRLLIVGETTGALPQSLELASEQLHARVSMQLDRVERLLGPLLLLLVGGLLIWIVLSLLMPVYQSAIAVVMQ